MKNHELKNGLFQGLEPKALQTLNRSVARPVPLWSFMPLEVGNGRKVTIPIASMLAIVSSYETVLAVTDAIVPVVKVDEESGSEKKLRRHYRYIDGKPAPSLTERRSPLAFLNHEHLHRVLLQHDAQARKILRGPRLPEELQNMVAGFRLIRAYRQKHSTIPHAMVQRWEVFKIDENVTLDTHPGKTPLIDPEKALTLEYTLQCPPCFEMMPRGFTPLLMKELGLFMGRDEPFMAETTTAYKYKLWMSSPVGQFCEMFKLEEQQRRELIETRGENVSAMPLQQMFKKKGERPAHKQRPPMKRHNKSANRENRAGGAPSVAMSSGGFGLAAAFPEPEVRQQAPLAIAVDEPDPEMGGFGLANMTAAEQDDVLRRAPQQEPEDGYDGPLSFWAPPGARGW